MPAEIDLTTQPLSSVSVELAWVDAANGGVVEYQIFVNDQPVGSTTDSSFVSDGLVPATEHCFRVRAIDAGGVGLHASNTSCAQTMPDELPTVPATLSADAVSSVRIELAWTPATDDFGDVTYRVLRDGGMIAETAETTYADTGLVAETTYTYQVQTVDSVGQSSAPSLEAVATTLVDDVAPSVVMGIVARYDGSVVELEWPPAVDETAVVGYRVERNGTTIATVVDPLHVDSAPLVDQANCYRVFAFDLIGNEPPTSDEACVHTGWRLDDVEDTAGYGRFVAIEAVDADELYVLHADGAALGLGSGVLRTSAWDGASWSTTDVVVSTPLEPTIDLARNGAGELELAALVRGPQLGLFHGTLENGAWVGSIVDADFGVGIHPALATGPAGLSHIAHLTDVAGMRYSFGSGNSWLNTRVAAPNAVVASPAVAVSPAGVVHLVLALMDPPSLGYVKLENGLASIAILPPRIDPYVAPMIGLDASDRLHVIFRDETGGLQHGARSGSSWDFAVATPPGVEAMLPSLAVAPNGDLHTAYLDVGHSAVVYAARIGGVWTHSIIDDDPSSGDRVAIGLGNDGQPAVAYRADDRLRVARRR